MLPGRLARPARPGHNDPMLLPPKVAQGVREGTLTLAFRRWRRPDVRSGSEFRTSAGVVRVESVEVIEPAEITDPIRSPARGETLRLSSASSTRNERKSLAAEKFL